MLVTTMRRRWTTSTSPALAKLVVWTTLLSLVGPSRHVAAFGTSPSALATSSSISTTRTSTTPRTKSKYVSVACSISGGGNSADAGSSSPLSYSNNGRNSQIFRHAVVVGMVTAAMGFVYGRVLDYSVRTTWKKLPSILAASSSPTSTFLANVGGSSRYIFCTMSLGGLLMGLLSSKLKPSYIVAEFVSTLSAKRGGADLPLLLPALPNLLILSLVTSTFGFSVGPEAPMVCAGGLIGAAMSRRWENSSDDGGFDDATCKKEILTYAGAAGALTAFMGIPLAGPIFALELTRASSGMTSAAKDTLGPAVAASAGALLLLRGFLQGSSLIGGHFSYGAIEALSGRAAMATSLLCGAGGALLGTGFHKFVHILKDILWKQGPNKNETKRSTFVTREVMVKTIIGIFVGLLSMMYPQTMFWGEGSLQCVVDGHKTPFAATKHGLSNALTGSALVDSTLPFQSSAAAAQVGLAKLVSISLACAGKFPGGIIFPLFFAAAPIAHSVMMTLSSHLPTHVVSSVSPTAVMCLMAATQASVTRTPLATVFMLALSAAPTTALSVMLPPVILSSYIGVWFSRFLSKDSYFDYSS